MPLRLDVMVFPVNSFIMYHSTGFGSKVDLIPSIFSEDDTAETIDKVLKRAGYKSTIPSNLIWEKYIGVKTEKRLVYTREASELICNIQLVIYIGFEKDGKIAIAKGTQQEHGCL